MNSAAFQRRIFFPIAALAVLSALLSGCFYIKENITIYQDEKWKAVMELSVPEDTFDLFGGEAGFESEFDLPEGGRGEIDGVKIRWSKQPLDDGSLRYIITTEGQGLEELNDVAFDGTAEIDIGSDGEISISYLPDWGMELMGFELEINAGEILSSNADEQSGGRAYWDNPSGLVEVELTPKSSFNLLLFAAIGFACLCALGTLAALSGGAIYYLSRRRRREADEV